MEAALAWSGDTLECTAVRLGWSFHAPDLAKRRIYELVQNIPVVVFWFTKCSYKVTLRRRTKVYGEDVPSRRSNHASAVWGDIVLCFGGWHELGQAPLARLELLHVRTQCKLGSLQYLILSTISHLITTTM